MQTKNKYFYIGKIPAEYDNEPSPEGWEEGWYYRFRIESGTEDLHLEDTCGRSVPIAFEHIYEFVQTASKVQTELITSIIGAPNPNA